MKLRILAVASVALLAAACGSSKKSTNNTPNHTAAHDVAYSGPTTPASISSAADAVAVASTSQGDVGDVMNGMNDTMTPAMSSLSGVTGPSATLSVASALRLAMDGFADLQPAQVAGVTLSDTKNCRGGGTVSGTITAANIDTPFRAAGDSGTLVFNLCVNAGGQLVDGVAQITIDAGDGTTDFVRLTDDRGLPLNQTFRVTIAFTDLTVADTNGFWHGLDGSLTMTKLRKTSPSNQIVTTVTGSGLVRGTGHGSVPLAGVQLTGPNGDAYSQQHVDYYTGGTGFLAADPNATDDTLNAKVCSTAMHGCVQFVTNTVVHELAADGNPSSGSFTITAGTKWVRYDIVSATSVNVSYDVGAGTKSVTQSQTCLDTNVGCNPWP